MRTKQTYLCHFVAFLIIIALLAITGPLAHAADKNITDANSIRIRQNPRVSTQNSNLFEVVNQGGSNSFAFRTNSAATNGPIIVVKQAGVEYQAVPYFEMVATNRLTGLLQTNKFRNGILVTQ